MKRDVKVKLSIGHMDRLRRGEPVVINLPPDAGKLIIFTAVIPDILEQTDKLFEKAKAILKRAERKQ